MSLMNTTWLNPFAKLVVIAMCASAMAACGGGGGGGGGGGSQHSVGSPQDAESSLYAQMMSVSPPANDARRFLTQATFGPTDSSTESVRRMGYAGWLDSQLQLPVHRSQHLDFFNARMREARASRPSAPRDPSFVLYSAWNSFLSAEDQLRQRTAFALSQIFVVSLTDDCLTAQPQAVASYADTLAAGAFGSYRALLEDITRHPAMGCYLSHLKNRKEDLTTGRQPDENFAREIMQLFSVGLYQLNIDGTPRRDGSGATIETYTTDDVKGLAKVFTGLSFSCSNTNTNCFWRGIDSPTTPAPEDIWTKPMMYYPVQHSVSEKRFLGVTIPAGGSTPDEQLRIALDALAKHPNTAPFISKQLIQRLVTSNPSPAYVQRVATRFKDTNGDLGAVVRSILLDREARLTSYANTLSEGKLREPVLRFTAFVRAVGAASQSGTYQLTRSTSTVAILGQMPFMAPSVFNFYRPGYVPPGSHIAGEALVAPEFQQLNESSLASYANFMQQVVDSGVGAHVLYADGSTKPDIRPTYLDQADAPILAAVKRGDQALVDHVNERLMYGTMSAALRAAILQEVERIVIPGNATDAQQLHLHRRKARYALLLATVSPDFLIQR